MRNQHIEKYLNEYRKMKNTDFAVMITGPWGCGKTHFIKKYLKNHCREKGEKEFIYISLNGINSIPDIDMKILGEIYRLPKNEKVLGLGKIFKGMAKTKFNLNLSDLIQLVGISTRINGQVLVFDDLERCLLKPEEILGYINTFVENKDAKVILIGDETQVRKAQIEETSSSSKYWIIKEKVVGKTFNMSENIEDVFDDLVSDEAFPQTNKIIAKNKSINSTIFKQVAKELGKYNYRALKHAFRDFEYFYPNIESEFCKNKEFLNELYKVFIALSYELQLGSFSASDIASETLEEEIVKEIITKNGEEKGISKFEKTLNRHGLTWSPLYESLNNIIFTPSIWKKILLNKLIDKEELSEAIRNSVYFPKKQPEWVNLWRWRQCEDEDLEKNLKAVQSKIKEYKYKSYEIIMHVSLIFIGLINEGVIKCSKEYIISKTKKYLDYLVEKDLFEVPDCSDNNYWFGRGSHELSYTVDDEEDFKSLVKIIDDAILKTRKRERIQSEDFWMEDIKHPNSQFLIDIGMNGKYNNDPIFKDINPYKFCKVVYEMPNLQKYIVGATCEKRYRQQNDKLTEELLFWESVSEELKIDSHSELIKPSIYNLNLFKENVDKIITALKSHKV